MGVADEILPGLAGLILRGVAGQAEDIIGVAGRAFDKARADDAETAFVQAEGVGDMGEERVFARMVGAVGDGDLEQSLKDVDEDMVVVGTDAVAVGIEEPGDLAGIGVETCDVLPGQVVDAGGVFLFAGRKGEDAAEGGDLVTGDGAVGLGHLGTKGKDGDGEADGLFRGGRAAQAVEDDGQGFALD